MPVRHRGGRELSMHLQGGRKRPLCGLVRGTAPCRFALGADPGQPARNVGQHQARRRLVQVAPGACGAVAV
jgi:hypothetical protein